MFLIQCRPEHPEQRVPPEKAAPAVHRETGEQREPFGLA